MSEFSTGGRALLLLLIISQFYVIFRLAMIKQSWRFILGALIGGGIGYALALLAQPAPRKQAERWRTLYQAAPEEREEQPAA